MKGYGFVNDSNWSINFTKVNVSNLCACVCVHVCVHVHVHMCVGACVCVEYPPLTTVHYLTQEETEGSIWSLGYMVEQTEKLHSTSAHKKRPYSSTSLILSLVELVILLVLFNLFLISVIHVSCSDRNRNGYIAIS